VDEQSVAGVESGAKLSDLLAGEEL